MKLIIKTVQTVLCVLSWSSASWATPLLVQGVPVTCINQAAKTYYVPATLIIAVLSIEGGRAGMAKRNTNGSYDLGNMQINTTWLPTLQRYGYSASQLQNNPCVNVMAGAWILSQGIANDDNYWRGVGDYHSHTDYLNAAYQLKVKTNYHLLLRYLS